MKRTLYLIFVTIWMNLSIIAQTPQHVTQTDKEQVNFWDSTTAMIIGVLIILALIIGRTWSKRIHKRRDEIVNKDKKEK